MKLVAENLYEFYTPKNPKYVSTGTDQVQDENPNPNFNVKPFNDDEPKALGNSSIKKWFDKAGVSSRDYTINDDLTINVIGHLDLEGTQITSLPDNLSVGGSLYLRGTQITSLPDNLSVERSLDLRGTPITSLPDNLSVGGDLDLEGTPITSLPDNLSVGGWLDLRDTLITSLPSDLEVGGNIIKDF